MTRVPSTAQLDLSVRGQQAEITISGLATADDVKSIVDEARRLIATVRTDTVTFQIAADHPPDILDPLPEAVGDGVGFTERRDLLQLRRPLPVEANHPSRASAPALTVRPIRLGPIGSDGSRGDVAAWLRVNNRAFVDHADQGRETVETFRARLDVEVGDPSGFLVADDPDRPGELAGFCWTKVHPVTEDDPALGEVYVIGVDPSHRGEGLGPPLVLAGLDHLAKKLDTAMLYVDADNVPARRLYDRLGFAIHQRRRVYTAPPS